MAQFAFLNSLNSAVKMDEPITRGPVPRYEKRKILENKYYTALFRNHFLTSYYEHFYVFHSTCDYSNLNSSTLNSSKSKASMSFSSSMSSGKTPKKHGDMNSNKKTPSKTPKKSPGNYLIRKKKCQPVFHDSAILI